MSGVVSALLGGVAQATNDEEEEDDVDDVGKEVE